MKLAYDGAEYRGWQRQAGGRTLQGVVEAGLAKLVGERVTLIASGRTDSGVHALGQVAHFLTRSTLATEVFRKGLNALTPADILILAAEEVPADFHARYGVKSKLYEYRLLNQPDPDLFERRYRWHISQPLDRAGMAEALRTLKGRHDFSAFRSSGSGNVNPVRCILRADLEERGPGRLVFAFEADGFLRHMVRNLVGTLVAVGLGRLDAAGFKEILRCADRRRAGVKAPPQGLFLVEVRY